MSFVTKYIRKNVTRVLSSCLVILFVASSVQGQIYNWRNGRLIRGTRNIKAQADANLSDRNLRYANLAGLDLSGANFNFSSLQYAKLSNATLDGADFIFTHLNKANFTNASITGANFLYATHYGFTKEQLYSTLSYIDGDLSGINLGYDRLNGWDFGSQNLSSAGFEYTGLYGANFNGATLEFASFFHAKLREADLSDANMASADFGYANLRNADMSRSDLTGAGFFGAADRCRFHRRRGSRSGLPGRHT